MLAYNLGMDECTLERLESLGISADALELLILFTRSTLEDSVPSGGC